jgi:hypothetical protein
MREFPFEEQPVPSIGICIYAQIKTQFMQSGIWKKIHARIEFDKAPNLISPRKISPLPFPCRMRDVLDSRTIENSTTRSQFQPLTNEHQETWLLVPMSCCGKFETICYHLHAPWYEVDNEVDNGYRLAFCRLVVTTWDFTERLHAFRPDSLFTTTYAI